MINMKVLFYYPRHFNRSSKGSNPFFDALIETCSAYGISYDIFEEPDNSTDKPHNSIAHRATIFFWTVTVLRKILSIALRNRDVYDRERIAAKILNIISFGKYKYDAYITISGSMFHFFACLNSKSKVFDMQHGILYKEHPTFFQNGRLRSSFLWPQLNLLFWGKGYEGCFIAGNENQLLGRTHVVGYPLQTPLKTPIKDRDRVIIVSMQFTYDYDEENRNANKNHLRDLLEATSSCGYKVLLKHHPRYYNCISIEDLLLKYSHAELTSESLESLAKYVCLHITPTSTTAFEYAAAGIPTFFMPYYGSVNSESLFYGEFNYPLYRGMDICDVLKRIENVEVYKEDCNIVVKWFREFYSPFDPKAFIKLLS